MGNDDKIANKTDSAVGKAKEKLGDATGNERPRGRGQEGPEQGRPQAGRREGQGRLQALSLARWSSLSYHFFNLTSG